MNHKNTTLAIVAIVSAVAMTAVAIPQQALAGGHHNHNHGSSIEVSQQADQLNACTNNATCANIASNSADIDR